MNKIGVLFIVLLLLFNGINCARTYVENFENIKER